MFNIIWTTNIYLRFEFRSSFGFRSVRTDIDIPIYQTAFEWGEFGRLLQNFFPPITMANNHLTSIYRPGTDFPARSPMSLQNPNLLGLKPLLPRPSKYSNASEKSVHAYSLITLRGGMSFIIATQQDGS